MAFGSLINTVQGNSGQRTPEVGDGATILMWSDRHAATIVAVSASGKQVTVQRDKAVRTDGNGMSDSQSYEFERDENGSTRRFSLRKNGAWVAVGSTISGGSRLGIGYRDEHYDYSF